jgi:Na+/H+ antiporter NhaC
VGVLGRGGGTQGVVEAVAGRATTRRKGQLLTYLAGLAIFFDDYANTLIVGNTMRPVTDRLRISREKLAYIVDSTSAPMAAVALISTWVGFELSLIGEALKTSAEQTPEGAHKAELMAGALNPFTVLLHSIPYLFYPLFALAFVLMTVLTRRDFGPMLRAEVRVLSGGGVQRPGAMVHTEGGHAATLEESQVPRRWYNAALPLAVVVGTALAGMYGTGTAKLGEGSHSLREVAGAADPLRSLLWAAFAGCLVAIVLVVGQRLLTLGEAMAAWLSGLRSMMLAVVILVLAWALGGVTEALGTGTYLSALLQESLPLRALPVLVFLVAAAISFSTGTSWGTMAILFPVVVPLAITMGAGVGFGGGGEYTVLLGVISSVMAGSIFGDHCSPISDTTVMSSMACQCDHLDHVQTQLPYALVVAAVALVVGDLATSFGLSPAISLVVGPVLLYLILRVWGRRPEDLATQRDTPAVAQPAVE